MPSKSIPAASPTQARRDKIRATQSVVAHMAYAWTHPSLTLIEVTWRWLIGVPVLFLLWNQAQQILTQIPPASLGLDRLEFQNPWLSSTLLAEAASTYAAPIAARLHWLLPTGILAWSISAGLGRTLLLTRMQRFDAKSTTQSRIRMAQKLPGMILLEALWISALSLCFWLWYQGVGWASTTYIRSSNQPELVGYLCWLIFLSLALYIAWAILSWTLAIAPVLYLSNPAISLPQSLTASFKLGREFCSKLVEINLVLAIVKIMLIVLDMVFSAAPLPFADELGPDSLHILYVVIFIAFLIANDYFQVVRLRSYLGLSRRYLTNRDQQLKLATDQLITQYVDLQADFARQILDVDEWFVSDESSLWDFTSENSLQVAYARISKLYGVDVSDVEGALLWKIFERIAARNDSQPKMP